jgi:hypothetical protein
MCHVARLAAFIIAATFSVHAAGCESATRRPVSVPASASAANPAKQVSQQLIVKFKRNSVTCTAQAIARFSKGASVPLEWLRPMSGDACVVIQAAGNAGELTKGQERLKGHPDVEWVEIDAVMQSH